MRVELLPVPTQSMSPNVRASTFIILHHNIPMRNTSQPPRFYLQWNKHLNSSWY